MPATYVITADEKDPSNFTYCNRIVSLTLSEEEYKKLKEIVVPILTKPTLSSTPVFPGVSDKEIIDTVRSLEGEYACKFTKELIAGTIRDYFIEY